MENRKYTKSLYTGLTDDERLEMTDELVGLNNRHNSLELEKKSAVANFNERQKSLETNMQDVFYKLDRNEKLGDVECEDFIDEKTKQVITTRLDTNTIIDVRRLTAAELQRDIPFDEIEYEESVPERHDDDLTKWIGEVQAGLREFAKDSSAGSIGPWMLTEDLATFISSEIPNGQVLSWIPEQYRVVERWVMLVKYALTHREKSVDLGDVPDVLLLEWEDDGEVPADYETEIDVKVDGVDRTVIVDSRSVPDNYFSTSFDAEDGVVTFWRKDGTKEQECQGRFLVDPDDEAEVEDTESGVDIPVEEWDPQTNWPQRSNKYVYFEDGENTGVWVSKFVIPKSYDSSNVNRETGKVTFWKGSDEIKTVKFSDPKPEEDDA